MKGYIENIEMLTRANEYYRKVLYTDERLQLVLMTLKPGEEIGAETHQLDQFIRVEEGEGTAILDGAESTIGDGSVVIVPQGVRHNIINTSATDALKLYTLYAPPNHEPGTIHETKTEADADDEHYGHESA
ncbi:MAG: cupin domain-containing protein [Candidatus Paceibacterota bacterium]